MRITGIRGALIDEGVTAVYRAKRSLLNILGQQ
jgi:hypothetical protein